MGSGNSMQISPRCACYAVSALLGRCWKRFLLTGCARKRLSRSCQRYATRLGQESDLRGVSRDHHNPKPYREELSSTPGDGFPGLGRYKGRRTPPALGLGLTHRRYSALRSAGETLQELFQREGVQDVFFLDPGATGGGDAEMDVIELCSGMGVGIDDEGDPGLLGPASVRVVEIEA